MQRYEIGEARPGVSPDDGSGDHAEAGRQQRIKAFERSACAAEDGRGTAAEDRCATYPRRESHPRAVGRDNTLEAKTWKRLRRWVC